MISHKTAKPIFRLLLVEDSPERIEIFRSWLPEGVSMTVASSAGKVMGILKRDRGKVYGGIMLDHDLGQGVLTLQDKSLSGTNLVNIISDCISPDIPILVHSINPEGRALMTSRLDAAGFDVTVIPMEHMTKEAFKGWLREAFDLWEDSNER